MKAVGPSPLDEAGFVESLKRGDSAAFERLVREMGPRMLAVAKRFLPNEDDARDVLQDAFLAAFRAIGKFEGNSRLSTWLHRITVNACLMKLRSRERRPERSIEDLLPRFDSTGHHATPISEWADRPQTEAERMESARVIREAIEQLPDSYRTVLLLRDIEGIDTEVAATMLGLTPNAAKTRLHRARMALRTLVEPHFREGSR